MKINLILLLLIIIECVHTKQIRIPKEKYEELNPGIESPIFNATAKIQGFSAEMSMYYSWFTTMGYCTESNFRQGKCCASMFGKGKPWELVDAGAPEDDSLNSYLFFKSDKYKKVVFTFPGTKIVKQFLEELSGTKLVSLHQDFDGIGVNKYFNNKAKNLFKFIIEKNGKEIKKYSDYQFIFTGHSLGGSIATIIAYLMLEEKFIDYKLNEPVLYTIGQPRTGNPVFGVYIMNKVPHVFRIARKGDIVTSFPLCKLNILNFKCNGFYRDSFGTIQELDNDYVFKKKPKPNGGYWHLGGLYVMNEKMDTFEECDYDKGENIGGNCSYKPKVNLERHLFYFDDIEELGMRCFK